MVDPARFLEIKKKISFNNYAASFTSRRNLLVPVLWDSLLPDLGQTACQSTARLQPEEPPGPRPLAGNLRILVR